MQIAEDLEPHLTRSSVDDDRPPERTLIDRHDAATAAHDRIFRRHTVEHMCKDKNGGGTAFDCAPQQCRHDEIDAWAGLVAAS